MIAVSISMIIYALFVFFKLYANDPDFTGDTVTMVMGIIEGFRTNTSLINLITMCSGSFIAVPISILILNAPKYRDVPLKGFQFSTPEEKARTRNLTPAEFGSFIMFMFPLGIIGSLIGNILALLMSTITGQTMTDILSSI